MTYIVKRTVTKVQANRSDDQIHISPQPLLDYQNTPAYVLLGDPGAGKTTAFEQAVSQEESIYVTARDLITFEDRPEWHDKTLFIDGLDEIRAGSLDARTPFDIIRARLEKLGHPQFRLSCREADWFGASDQELLKTVSPDNEITILHLDSLTEEHILEILKQNLQVADAEVFMQQAKLKGLNELLTNPQILDMLVKAVDGNNWPETRKQTFEMACQTIIREHNQEHINATHTQPADENKQLNAVGYLCAVQLISGKAGYTLTSNMASSNFPFIGDVTYENSNLLHEVIRTKLFKKGATDEYRIPIHRHIAEYLAARYINERIDTGLPIGRILSLITGEDGVVVAELRGLSAWLAALCKSQRSVIIERDPLGVVLYGDVQDFTYLDKRRVLEGLQREADRYPWFRSSNWTASPFGALATPDMEDEFRNILTEPDRSETHQALTDCILDAMSHGIRFPSLNDALLSIVRDATWWLRVRRQALKVIYHNGEGKPDNVILLKSLMVEIKNGTVVDSDDDLTGYLLSELYPQSIPTEEVLNYLHVLKRPNLIGSYLRFWDRLLLDQSSDYDIRILLDEITKRLEILQPVYSNHQLRDLPTKLLARGLETHGESVDSIRLYGWLGVGLDKYGHSRSNTNLHSDKIRSWLEAHPTIQKDIIGVGLNRCVKKENFVNCMHKVRGRLFHAKLPDNYGRWCLDRMQTTTDDNVARYLLHETVSAVSLQQGNEGISLELIEKTAEQDKKYMDWISKMLVCPVDPEQWEHLEKQRRRKAKEYEAKQEWLRHAKSHENELREGRANLRLLHDLATAYFGHFIDSKGDTPMERLQYFLYHDKNLVQSVLEGLRRSLKHNDLPTVKDIIELYTNNETHLLSRPFLAGLNEITRTSSENINHLSNEQISQAVAFYLADGTGENPGWYELLLTSHPDLVAEVTITYVSAALRSNKQHITGLYALAYIDTYSSVANLTSLSLLKTFPVRSTEQQLMSLDELLIAALRYTDKKELLGLIEKKLNMKSMSISQRIRWLAAGLITAPDKYEVPLAEFTKLQEKRVQHLASFLADRHDQWSPLDALPVSTLGLLLRLIGEFFAPYSFEGGGWVSPAMNAADFVSSLIKRLGSQPEKEAADMLDALMEESGLRRWHDTLRRAQFEQCAIRREVGFQHPDIRQVRETLNNQLPANAGDLAALTIDILQELAHQIRNGDTDDYRQFWNEGSRRELETPKHEDACRDALLSDLKQRLGKFRIDAQPEGHYADDNRADIRIAFGSTDRFEVPIEIKKNTHRNLWRAIHDQLIAKYTRDPHAHDFGIYLVFWFGSEYTQPPPSGSRPQTSDELEKRLRATLSADENRKISVCVINVAKPG